MRRKEDREEEGWRRGKGRGRRERMGMKEASRAAHLGSGGPGFPECPDDPDVRLQADHCFGTCPSRGQGELGRRKRERQGAEKPRRAEL